MGISSYIPSSHGNRWTSAHVWVSVWVCDCLLQSRDYNVPKCPPVTHTTLSGCQSAPLRWLLLFTKSVVLIWICSLLRKLLIMMRFKEIAHIRMLNLTRKVTKVGLMKVSIKCSTCTLTCLQRPGPRIFAWVSCIIPIFIWGWTIKWFTKISLIYLFKKCRLVHYILKKDYKNKNLKTDWLPSCNNGPDDKG